MQIFEITARRRQKIDEITLGGVKQAIGSVGTALGQIANVKAGEYVKQQTGISGNVDANPYGAQQSRAADAAKPVIEKQAIEQHKLWSQGLAQAMQAAGVTNIAAIPTAQQDEIKRSLLNAINTRLLQGKTGRDYTSLPSQVDKDPAIQTQAQKIVDTIDAAVTTLMTLSAANYDAVSKTAWQNLAQAAYEAMALTQFSPSAEANMAVPALIRMGVTRSALNAMRRTLRTLPSVRAGDPRTDNYLAAFGFKPMVTSITPPAATLADISRAGISATALTNIKTTLSRLPDITSGNDDVEDWATALGFRL